MDAFKIVVLAMIAISFIGLLGVNFLHATSWGRDRISPDTLAVINSVLLGVWAVGILIAGIHGTITIGNDFIFLIVLGGFAAILVIVSVVLRAQERRTNQATTAT